MKHPFIDQIARRILVCDGAMGTRLYERGIGFDTSFDSLCLTNPDLVKDVHREYIEAGADIIETNTFGANRFRLKQYHLDDEVHLINRAGAQIARQAREEMGRDIFVAGSVGPTGGKLFPLGRVTEDEVYDAFREQVAGLIEGGVDLFIVETFSSLDEITLAIKAIRNQTGDIPIVAQMTFGTDGVTLFGHTPEDCAEALSELNVNLIGANCSVGPQMLAPVIEKMAEVCTLPISAQPNASLPKYIEGRYIYHVSPDYFAEAAGNLLSLGVRLIGGCCGTTPEHIRKLVAMVQSRSEQEPTQTETGIHPEEVQIRVTEKRKSVGISKFASALQSGFAVSVEVDPPRGSNPDKILNAAEMLSDLGIDAVNIADSPMARVRMGAQAAAALIIQRTGMDTILHMTCRDRNLMGLQSDLLGAHALGVRNILAVTGDPPMSGNYPNVTAVYDVDAIGLLKIIDSLNRAEDMGGNSIGYPTALTPGVAVNPVSDDMKRELERFRIKESLGAVFAMTQPVYESKTLERFLDSVGDTKIKIIAGILPLVSFRHASFMHHEVPGIIVPPKIRERLLKAGESASEVSIEMTVKLLENIKNLVSGVYFMPSFGRYHIIAEIIRQAGLAVPESDKVSV